MCNIESGTEIVFWTKETQMLVAFRLMEIWHLFYIFLGLSSSFSMQYTSSVFGEFTRIIGQEMLNKSLFLRHGCYLLFPFSLGISLPEDFVAVPITHRGKGGIPSLWCLIRGVFHTIENLVLFAQNLPLFVA